MIWRPQSYFSIASAWIGRYSWRCWRSLNSQLPCSMLHIGYFLLQSGIVTLCRISLEETLVNLSHPWPFCRCRYSKIQWNHWAWSRIRSYSLILSACTIPQVLYLMFWFYPSIEIRTQRTSKTLQYSLANCKKLQFWTSVVRKCLINWSDIKYLDSCCSTLWG